MVAVDSAIFHAYIYGTAFWYATRGLCRVWDPAMVAGWFHPPSEPLHPPTTLELYNIRTDGWCLVTLSLILISLRNAIPLELETRSSPSKSSTTSSKSALKSSTATAALRPCIRAITAATVFHHLVTGLGAYSHYQDEGKYNFSMGVGVWGNVWLVLWGMGTWVVLGG